jgi:NAD(P)-dependent dehydrogenase (short-subunit alcohol dehydrogenase family)
MTTDITVAVAQREPTLVGQTVVVVGGSAGIGLETARQARAEGADVILTARDPDRLQRAAAELGARSTAAFDATDPDALDRFFAGLPATIDHVMVTGPGPYYAALASLDRQRAHRDFGDHICLAVAVAQHAVGRVLLDDPVCHLRNGQALGRLHRQHLGPLAGPRSRAPQRCWPR